MRAPDWWWDLLDEGAEVADELLGGRFRLLVDTIYRIGVATGVLLLCLVGYSAVFLWLRPHVGATSPAHELFLLAEAVALLAQAVAYIIVIAALILRFWRIGWEDLKRDVRERDREVLDRIEADVGDLLRARVS